MWEAHALISYKTAKKRHWDETEEDDEENCATDDSLWLWSAEMCDQGREANWELKVYIPNFQHVSYSYV